MRLKDRLIGQLKTMLFHNTTTATGGEAVRELFKAFQKQVLRTDPLNGRTDQAIWLLLKKLEGMGAPLGDSSENTQLLKMLLYNEFDTGLGKGKRSYFLVLAFALPSTGHP